jgi:hydrogenase maturation protease
MASPFLIQKDMATLFFGFGNKDRQDDGVAWHVLNGLSVALGNPATAEIAEDFAQTSEPALVFQLQLMPEQSEFIAAYDRICFIDAHTGAFPEDIRCQPVVQHYQRSPLTHHLSPESLLSITNTIYKKSPEAILLSIRGYKFGFTQTLSDQTQRLVPQAVDILLDWLNQKSSA